MGPDAIVRETPFDILKDITLTQVVSGSPHYTIQ